ncbi:HAD-IB family hydrolase [Acidiferrimicrobium sp. IK]|uniref:HAD family hydrolase n=1 Tax=Acidiferrimicrobium sp. IK TaxID=2871700 RepID=UPI0021CB1E42|nr:HAD-IB family hydrolase [Acidiferrimicrobium sp. IK]MCU4187430.1 HAD-IB family hydrolase [Acidiferrimicrobium sp. IK]
MEAAFFDLDKTVIAKASMMAFGREFYREGLIGRRSLLKGLWTQVVYVRRGATSDQLAKIRQSVLALIAGWEQARVRSIVTSTLAPVLDPITYAEAIEAIEEHRGAGRLIVIISAAPEEIVEPLAAYLGVDVAIGSRADVDERGRYTGHMARYAYGQTKADLMAELAETRGIDLANSWAYSDSVTDLPMLEAVGHPVVVNPDRSLERLAAARGWPVRHFDRMVERTEPGLEAPGRPLDEPAAPRAGRNGKVGWLLIGAPTVVLLTTGGALWWRRRLIGNGPG